MPEYIDKSALYEKIAQMEEVARNRYLETLSNNPCYSRYVAQLNERTAFKHLVADFPATDVEPVVHGEWLLKHIGVGHYWDCSVCHTNPCIYVTQHTKFCPNCGAKMDLDG